LDAQQIAGLAAVGDLAVGVENFGQQRSEGPGDAVLVYVLLRVIEGCSVAVMTMLCGAG
jgi:hypothetical protein